MNEKTIYNGCITLAFSGDLNKVQKIAQKFIGKANVNVSTDYETHYLGGQAIRLGGHVGSAEINLVTISGKAVEKIIKILLDEVGENK